MSEPISMRKLKAINARRDKAYWPYCRRCMRIMTSVAEIFERRCKLCGRRTRTFWEWK